MFGVLNCGVMYTILCSLMCCMCCVFDVLRVVMCVVFWPVLRVLSSLMCCVLCNLIVASSRDHLPPSLV